MFWQIVGWVFLALLLLLVLLLVLPAAVALSYHKGELSVKVRILFFRLQIWPLKPRKKPRKDKPPKEKKPKKEKPEKEKPPPQEKTLSDRLELIRRILDSAGPALGFMLDHIHFKDVDLAIVVDTGDAAETAIWYGRLHAILGSLKAAMDNKLHVRYKRFALYPGFGDMYEYKLHFGCKISAAPIFMLVAGGIGLVRFINYRKQFPALQNQPAAAAKKRQAAQQRSKDDGKH